MPLSAAATAARANALRAQLVHYLGGQCAACGATHDLQINHIYVRTWTPRRITHYRRTLRYWREAKAGLVNLLCSDCNSVYKPLPLPLPDPSSLRSHEVAATLHAAATDPF